jgi:two-component system cell cycle response regulator DivK
VLLIEDNDINRQLTGEYLEHCGYQVFTLASGANLTTAMAEFRPDVILLDLKLPDVDGYHLLDLLRRHPEWQTIPVIVVSAFAFQADQERAFALGAKQYLVKPVKLQQLQQAICAELPPQTPED